MSTPTTTVPAARAWLLTQLTKAAASVQIAESGSASGRQLEVIDSHPLAETANDQLVVGAVERSRKPLTMMGVIGAGSQLEDVSIQLTITAWGFGGDTTSDVCANAYAWMELAEQVIDADPTLGGLAIRASLEHSSAVPSLDNSGPLFTITCHVTYAAQI